MPRNKITSKNEEGVGLRVYVESDRLEDNQRLHVVFTDEGIVFDVVDDDGAVIKTWSTMYDELVDRMTEA
jgi:hypothetical protein